MWFASLQDGWVYGPGLWSTHDGGSTWQKDRQVASVRAFAVRGGSAWAVEGWCPGDSAKPCHYTLVETSGGPDRWRTVARLTGVQGRAVALARAGRSTGWILSYAAYLPQNRPTSTLFMTADGGRTWRRLPSPCGSWVEDDELAALDTMHVFAVCGDGMATAMQPKSFAVSADGGRRWTVFGACHGSLSRCTPKDGPGWDGHISGLAASTPRVAWLAENRGTLMRTRNAGRTWQPAIPKQRISPGDQTVGPVQFVDPLHGWVAAGPNEVYRTVDGGNTWHSSAVK
jgi:photosystem II stability/assembly factor-like uncharacterized protein